jgi:hypothetical protein
MKTLYESILSQDYDLNDQNIATQVVKNAVLNQTPIQVSCRAGVLMIGYERNKALRMDFNSLYNILVHYGTSIDKVSFSGGEVWLDLSADLDISNMIFELPNGPLTINGNSHKLRAKKCEFFVDDWSSQICLDDIKSLKLDNCKMGCADLYLRGTDLDARGNDIFVRYEIAFKLSDTTGKHTRKIKKWLDDKGITEAAYGGNPEGILFVDPCETIGLVTKKGDLISDHFVFDVSHNGCSYTCVHFFHGSEDYDPNNDYWVQDLMNGWTMINR